MIHAHHDVAMNSVKADAIAIVHEGLADVLEWLGEKPQPRHTPRHAKNPWKQLVPGVWLAPPGTPLLAPMELPW